MFSSINFLFLLSLGFLSWTILCYIQQIEQLIHLTKNIPQELPNKEEIPIMAEPAHHQTIKPAIITNHNNFNLCLNFLCIVVCFYALVKITHLAEAYLAKSIRHKIYMPNIQDADIETPAAINDLQDQQENLKLKINKLEKQNDEMNFKLKSVVENQTPAPIDVDDPKRNIFITNKHIHLNRQIYVTHNMELEKPKVPEPSIWEKYMELKKSTTSFLSDGKISTHIPVVMSKEDLDNITSNYY